MEIVTKRVYEEFLITIDFGDRFQVLESIASFSVVCVNLCTNTAEPSLLFYEDSVYQAEDVAYGEGRYGGVPDNMVSSVTFGIANGIVGNKYKITAVLTTNLGSVYEEDVILEVIDDVVEGYLQKQPSEKFVILASFVHRLNNDDIRYDDTIASQTVTVIRQSDGVDVTNSVVFSSGLEGTEKVKIGIQAGSDIEDYRIINKIVSVQGYKYQLDSLLSVKDK